MTYTTFSVVCLLSLLLPCSLALGEEPSPSPSPFCPSTSEVEGMESRINDSKAQLESDAAITAVLAMTDDLTPRVNQLATIIENRRLFAHRWFDYYNNHPFEFYRDFYMDLTS